MHDVPVLFVMGVTLPRDVPQDQGRPHRSMFQNGYMEEWVA
jgi:hypothetical protein